MRSIRLFGKEMTGWQVLPADAQDFEEAALRACELVLGRDPRIGKKLRSDVSPLGTGGTEESSLQCCGNTLAILRVIRAAH